MKIAFIGLGNMGFPMAGHLIRAGHEVTVYNRTTAIAEKWVATYGGEMALSPARAADGADFVALCVGGDQDVRDVCLGGDGAITSMSAGSVLIDHTTASSALALEIHEEAQLASVGFLDAPISGGQAGAENGALSIMCGGNVADFDKAEPVMAAYGKTITHIGGPGAGQLTKMCNQILCAGAIVGAAEALSFGKRAGLDMEKVLAAVTQGAAGSWYLSNRADTMLADEFGFGFAVDWMAKDLRIVTDTGSEIQADTPLVQLAQQLLIKAQEAGDSELDATAIIRQYK